MSDVEPSPIGASDSGFVCPVCGQTFDRERQHCATCGSNLVVRRDDDEVYDRIIRMCGNPCSPPGSGGRE